jgi:hypothetical protein
VLLIKNQKNLFVMKRNIGTNDRIIRLLMAALITILYFTNAIPESLTVAIFVIAVCFVLTALISVCPIYATFGIDTCEETEHEN